MLMEKDMWNRIAKNAKAQNISFGEYIRRAVAEYIDFQKKILSQEKPVTPFNRFFKAGRK